MKNSSAPYTRSSYKAWRALARSQYPAKDYALQFAVSNNNNIGAWISPINGKPPFLAGEWNGARGEIYPLKGA